MLRRRHHAQEEAPGEAEGGQEEDAHLRQGRNPAVRLHRSIEDGRGVMDPAVPALSLRDRIGIDFGRKMPAEDAVAWAAANEVRFIDVELALVPHALATSEEGRVGKEFVSTLILRGFPFTS